MTRFLTALIFAASAAIAPAGATDPDKPIGHMVYFKLKDRSPAARDKLVAACKKYLENHDGVRYFAAGVLAEEFDREVNDRDWDVALHLVFANKASHDKYQDHPDHIKFIEENKDNWAKVRVFDSIIGTAAAR